MRLLLNLLISAVTIFAVSYILPGVRVDSFVTAFIVAVVLGLINAIIKPLLLLLTLPLTIMTFGLFAFVLNGVFVLVVSQFVPGFHVDNILWAMLFSIVVSVVSSILNHFLK